MGSTRSFVLTAGRAPARSVINASMYSSFFKAGQSSYRCRHCDCGVNQTANISGKSSSGWLCAYHMSRCWTWRVISRIGLGRAAEHKLANPSTSQAIGVSQRMPGFGPENADTSLRRSSFHLQHLDEPQPGQPGMGQIKRHRDAGHPVGRKPFAREPEVGTKEKAAQRQFIVELANVPGNLAPLHRQTKITEPQIEQFFVRPISPFLRPRLRRLHSVRQRFDSFHIRPYTNPWRMV